LGWGSGRRDETYRKIPGVWYALARAVDKQGQPIDGLLTEPRDEHAATRFLTKAIRRHGVPAKIPLDGSAAHETTIKSDNEAHGTAIVIRKIQYLNTIVAQDPRAVQRVPRPMLGLQAFTAAQDKPCHDLLYISGAFRRLYPVGTVGHLPWWMRPQNLGAGRL
jgi:transposase-like protein